MGNFHSVEAQYSHDFQTLAGLVRDAVRRGVLREELVKAAIGQHEVEMVPLEARLRGTADYLPALIR
jgi:hypothetical protein